MARSGRTRREAKTERETTVFSKTRTLQTTSFSEVTTLEYGVLLQGMYRPLKPTQRRSATARGHEGFTLVELLIVIVIVATLAALVFSISKNALRSAAGAKDMATMRQIWQTIPIYSVDHGDTLPGPLNTGQKSLYSSNILSGRLSYHIAEDLGYTNPKTDDFIEMLSFSWQKSEKARKAPCFYMPQDVSIASNPNQFIKPWGYPTAANKNDRKPKKMAGVMSAIDPSRVWALSDIDQLHPDVGSADWKADIPEKMSHDTYRIAIYFDGHAGKLDVNNNPR